MQKNSSYRPDIDGLRAIAVLAVILFHFKVIGFSGGYIGVDIFFVISGYLITRIIVKEVAEGTFSLLNFWGRRIRRIIPALVVVTTTIAAASYFILILPSDYIGFGKTLMTQSVFLSNWWFMGISDYFAAPAETMPLLHTWTLAVEEQFYIFLPLLITIIYPYVKKRLGLVLITVAALSFMYGVFLVYVEPTGRFAIPLVPHIWGTATNSSAGFYFIFPRIWELLVGGIIAVYSLQIANRATAEIISYTGLGAIIAGIFLISETTPFPGVAALLPVLGAAAIIVANTYHHTVVKKILSLPTMVGIGLISYSLYLWHWPLLVLARYYAESTERRLFLSVQFLLLIFIFLLSFFTYRYVETPFRNKNFLLKRKKLYFVGLVGLLVIFCIGSLIVSKQGFPNRVSPGAQEIASAMEDFGPRRDECLKEQAPSFGEANKPCLLGVQDPSYTNFVLWGDSHAAATIPAFDAYGLATDKTGIFFGRTTCAPLTSNPPISDSEMCLQEVARAISFIQQNVPEEVFLVAEWREKYPFVSNPKRGLFLSEIVSNTIKQLPSETQIYVLLRIPTYPQESFRESFFHTNHKSIFLTTRYLRSDFEAYTNDLDSQIKEAALKYPNARILNPLNTLCDDEYCYRGSSEGLYYYDSSHLSTHGAKRVILPLLLGHER